MDLSKGMNYKVGDRLYSVVRFDDDGKLHLCKFEIADVVVTYTPTGKPRRPKFFVKMVTLNEVKAREDVGPMEQDIRWYSRTATRAVRESLMKYFGGFCNRSSDPEAKLLRAIYGEDQRPDVAADEIADMIHELKNFHKLFRQAFEEDDKTVQEVVCE